MSKFKLGVIVGFAAGWAVGSGRAAELFSQLQQSMSRSEPTAGTASEAGGFGRSAPLASEATHRNVASA